MKFRSLFASRTENLGIKIIPTDLKRIMDKGERNFQFEWLSENNFVISLNFSFGSNIIFDVNYLNTKSDIIFYGTLTEIEDSKTKIVLKSRSKDLLAVLALIVPVLVLCFQLVIKMQLPTFIIAFTFFPLIIIGLLNLIRGEEEKLLRRFKNYLNKEILTHYNNK